MQKVYNLQKKNFSSENFVYSSCSAAAAAASFSLRCQCCAACAWLCHMVCYKNECCARASNRENGGLLFSCFVWSCYIFFFLSSHSDFPPETRHRMNRTQLKCELEHCPTLVSSECVNAILQYIFVYTSEFYWHFITRFKRLLSVQRTACRQRFAQESCKQIFFL